VLASTLARPGAGSFVGLGGGYGSLTPRSAAEVREVRVKIATAISLRSTVDEYSDTG
jgi:hypothetical protein